MQQLDIQLTRDRVAAELRRSILTGSLPPRGVITQDHIAEMLGVSRMPVREALQLLASEGLITMHPNKAAVVNEISEKYIRDHFEIRSMLEEEAVARACANSVPEEMVEVQKLTEEAIRDNDYTLFNTCNQKMHRLFWKSSGNIKLELLLSQMWNGMFVDRSIMKHAKLSTQEHQMMIDCIVRRDPEKARAIMHQHLMRSMQRIIDKNFASQK